MTLPLPQQALYFIFSKTPLLALIKNCASDVRAVSAGMYSLSHSAVQSSLHWHEEANCKILLRGVGQREVGDCDLVRMRVVGAWDVDSLDRLKECDQRDANCKDDNEDAHDGKLRDVASVNVEVERRGGGVLSRSRPLS